MEGVVRGNKRRDKLMKRFGQIKDIHSVRPDEFSDEPALQDVLERWLAESGAASDALRNMAAQRQAIVALTEKLQQHDAGGAPLHATAEQPELARLVSAINDWIQSGPAREQQAGADGEPPTNGLEVGERLRDAQDQLLGFADSIAESVETLERIMAAGGTGADCAAAIVQSPVSETVARATQRLASSRQHLEALAEESNRLAIQAALHVSRLGEPDAEMLRVTEEIRTLSTRYQRLAAELRLSEGDHELLAGEWHKLQQRAAASGASRSGADWMRKLAMVMEQNAGGLEELATSLADEIERLTGSAVPKRPKRAPRPQPAPAHVSREITPPPVQARQAPPARQQAPIAPAPVQRPIAPAPAQPRVQAPAQPRAQAPVQRTAPPPPPRPNPASAPVVPVSGPRRPVEVAQEADNIYEMAELGGRELDESGEPIYELLEFGAVQL
jgi:hypothetical protein